ncbi:MAG: protein-glutamate O-methyltransferase [Acidimicrobiales bacterium]
MTDTMPDRAEREFPYEQRHFDSLRRLAREEAGIELAEHKRELVYGRVCRRLRELRLTSFDEYVALVTPKDSPERPNFVNCITTNVTAFFREGHHFTFLHDEAIPQLMKTRQASRRLRIWSAACSTGQEPYSIAITMARAMERQAYPWDWKVLATDIDSNVVARAQAGVYGMNEIPGYETAEMRRWFRRADGTAADGSSRVQVEDSLRQAMYFRVLNLFHPWPMQGPIDVIFCRNVVIYFSKEDRRALFNRFAQIMAPDGYLFIGHSESMLDGTDQFEPVGRTIYRLKSS